MTTIGVTEHQEGSEYSYLESVSRRLAAREGFLKYTLAQFWSVWKEGLLPCLSCWPKPIYSNWLKPFTAAGRMSLTLYVIHVTIGIVVLEYIGLDMDSQPLWVPISVAIGFYAFSLCYASAWERAFGRGLLEILMRKTKMDKDVLIVQKNLERQRIFCSIRHGYLKRENINEKKNERTESKAA